MRRKDVKSAFQFPFLDVLTCVAVRETSCLADAFFCCAQTFGSTQRLRVAAASTILPHPPAPPIKACNAFSTLTVFSASHIV